jgi:hypothetical protein
MAVVASVAAALASCATLNDLPQNTCGNLIIEQTDNEDCDTFPLGADGGVTAMDAGFACSSACRVLCTAVPDAGADAGGAADAGPRCPDGWGCGTDGICRRPNGTFAPAAVDIPEPVEHLLLGDLDGDGRQDVVVDTGNDLRVHYFSSGASLDQTASFSAPQTVAALGDFNNDGITDVAYSLPESVAVRLGSSDRSLPAVPFPFGLPDQPPMDLALQRNERIISLGTVPLDANLYKLREVRSPTRPRSSPSRTSV